MDEWPCSSFLYSLQLWSILCLSICVRPTLWTLYSCWIDGSYLLHPFLNE
jgi:hypothetical protein